MEVPGTPALWGPPVEFSTLELAEQPINPKQPGVGLLELTEAKLILVHARVPDLYRVNGTIYRLVNWDDTEDRPVYEQAINRELLYVFEEPIRRIARRDIVPTGYFLRAGGNFWGDRLPFEMPNLPKAYALADKLGLVRP